MAEPPLVLVLVLAHGYARQVIDRLAGVTV
jgi:hypothetical protein